MSGMGSGDLYASSWGWFPQVNDDDEPFRMFRITVDGEVACYIGVQSGRAEDALMMAYNAQGKGQGVDWLRRSRMTDAEIRYEDWQAHVIPRSAYEEAAE